MVDTSSLQTSYQTIIEWLEKIDTTDAPETNPTLELALKFFREWGVKSGADGSTTLHPNLQDEESFRIADEMLQKFAKVAHPATGSVVYGVRAETPTKSHKFRKLIGMESKEPKRPTLKIVDQTKYAKLCGDLERMVGSLFSLLGVMPTGDTTVA